jgi:hypothetical protein
MNSTAPDRRSGDFGTLAACDESPEVDGRAKPHPDYARQAEGGEQVKDGLRS